MTPILIIPGWGNSGEGHWQTLWAERVPGASRVVMPDWDRPERAAWVEALDRAIASTLAATGRAPVLVAHSLGCLAVAHWARTARHPVEAALLVAPADVERTDRSVLGSFGPAPTGRLGFRSIVVASDDDPYIRPTRAVTLTATWGGRLVLLRGAGHINAASGHGEWPDGLALLGQLLPAVSGERRQAAVG